MMHMMNDTSAAAQVERLPPTCWRLSFFKCYSYLNMEKIIAYTDGGSRGNPGPAAIGVQIVDESGVVVKEVSESIGNSTNNFAEYQGVMVALQNLKEAMNMMQD